MSNAAHPRIQPSIVERLRNRDAVVLAGLFYAIPAMLEAANRIEELEAALEQFRHYAEDWPADVPSITGSIDLDLIRAALSLSRGVAVSR